MIVLGTPCNDNENIQMNLWEQNFEKDSESRERISDCKKVIMKVGSIRMRLDLRELFEW